jgi:hypothetical protein
MADWLQRIAGEMKPAMGGTELMVEALKKHTKFLEYENINLISSTPNINKVRYTKKNLLWQHLNYTDETLGP